MAKSIAPFKGFPKEGIAFLRGLEADNSKAYFDANRDVYDEHVVAPSRSFVVALGEMLQDRISPAIVAQPKANGSLGRINRDIRFSADKRPYNTHLQFSFWEGENKKQSPAFVMWLAPDRIMIGTGTWPLDKAALERFRGAVVSDESGPALVEALAKAKKAKAEPPEPSLKRVPKGYDPEHPRGHLLRYKTLTLGMRVDTPKLVHSAKFAKWCCDRMEKLAPVQRWLVSHL